MLDLTHHGVWARAQGWSSGRGNTVSNAEQKAVSERADDACNRATAFEGRDAILTMTLSVPGTCTVVSCPACWQWSMNARPCKSHPTVGVLALDAIFSTQLTVGVLSHRVPSGACLMQGALSKITPMAKTSAASSRSELVIPPFGLSSETTFDEMSFGNALRHTMGCIGLAGCLTLRTGCGGPRECPSCTARAAGVLFQFL